MIGLLDVPCEHCGAKAGEPCKRALYPHRTRYDERDRQRMIARAGERAK